MEKEEVFGKGYKPWNLEIFKDIITETKLDALLLNEYYCQTAYRKYSSYVYVKKSNFYISEKIYLDRLRSDPNLNRSDGILSTKTLYLGDGDLRFAIYSRHSKTAAEGTEKPCVHLEWRIQWNDNYKRFILLDIIKKNAGYLESLKNLTGLKAAEAYEKLCQKHIKFSEIDKIAFAKHHQGWTNKKKFTRGDEFKLSGYALRSSDISSPSPGSVRRA